MDHKTKQDDMNMAKSIFRVKEGFKRVEGIEEWVENKRNQNALSACIKLSKGKINWDGWGKNKKLSP